MCNLWASYMQSYKIVWLVNNWKVAYLLEHSSNLATSLPMCVWHVPVCDWNVCSLECVGCQECLLEGASSLCRLFCSKSPKSRQKWLGRWGREKMWGQSWLSLARIAAFKMLESGENYRCRMVERQAWDCQMYGPDEKG